VSDSDQVLPLDKVNPIPLFADLKI
jgi:hypothetical protein